MTSMNFYAQRPADIPEETSVTDLAAELVGHSLALLAHQHVLAERMLTARWPIARDALLNGASTEDVAEAVGLLPEDLAAGLRGWADYQRSARLLTDAAHAEVVTLLGGAR
ncbi:hypothetical protein ACTXG6_40330 [Pseudonocardia sp. Cha107L01]|uniref:hypothetical protein n=1 Tax=Pseudonocardia sp. Cha107L01 TaxID=3457576 RepID=UPI00403EA1C3